MVFTQRRVPQKVVYVGGKISGLLFKVPLIIHYVHAKFRDLRRTFKICTDNRQTESYDIDFTMFFKTELKVCQAIGFLEDLILVLVHSWISWGNWSF